MRWRWMRPAGRAQAFDDFAASYDRRDELTRGWVTDWLCTKLDGRHGQSAIDLGCGTGRTALLLADHYQSVRAVDLSSEMIKLARAKRSHPRVVYEHADIDQVTGTYDLVLSIMVLHHVPDLAHTLAKIAAMVAPGGIAILVDPAQPPKTRWQFHLVHFLGFCGRLRAREKNAWERFRLESDRRWLDHLVSDRFVTVDQFRSIYAEALPGAVIEPVYGFYAAVWHRR